MIDHSHDKQDIDSEENHFHTYKIAGLTVAIRDEGRILMEQGAAYRDEHKASPDIVIDITEEYLLQMQLSNPHLSLDECAYITSGSKFYYNLLNFDGFMLHSSAVLLDGKAYLFSAPSGVGKSTHTALWCNYFGSSRARILNDDKPAIRRIDEQFIAFGTPWSGNSALNLNECAPIEGIAFIERSTYDWILPNDNLNSIFSLLDETYRTCDSGQMDRMLSLLGDLIIKTPIYRMGCTVNLSTVELAYSTMNKERGERYVH